MSRGRLANTNYPQKRKNTKNKNNFVFDVKETKQVVKAEPDVRKKFSQHDIKHIKPLTENQMYAFQEWAQGQHLVLEGHAGTGKTFIALTMALQTVLDPESEQDKIIIVRSAVPTRETGFLPGSLEEKNLVYETPYMQICDQLFKWKNSYSNLKEIGIIDFQNTSYLRGCTWDNAIIIFDEMQSNSSHEFSTVLTRIGNDSRVIVCGDDLQNDIGSKSGCLETLKILQRMESVSFIDFKLEDIVRSGFVKEFLMAKYGH